MEDRGEAQVEALLAEEAAALRRWRLGQERTPEAVSYWQARSEQMAAAIWQKEAARSGIGRWSWVAGLFSGKSGARLSALGEVLWDHPLQILGPAMGVAAWALMALIQNPLVGGFVAQGLQAAAKLLLAF
ncbi:MAG: hypothetical protein IMW99_05900 [Firmicutes bacterium]|nr:hypothetical protein [Bacillota bacterium]